MTFFTGACGILALVGLSCAQRTCTVDDVVLSLSAVEYLADKMQFLVDATNNTIDPSGPAYQNYLKQTNHLTQDLQCNANITSLDQRIICGAYERFSQAQLRYLHVSDGLKFYQANGHGENAVKMHGIVLVAGRALMSYTARVKEISPECADHVDGAYAPLGAQLLSLQATYPGTGQ